jgi:hypothetical protein
VYVRAFVATKKVAVDDDDPDDATDAPAGDAADAREDAPPAFQLVARKAGTDAMRIAALSVAGMALLAAGFLARAWLIARYELQELRMQVSELAEANTVSALPTSAAEDSDDGPAASGAMGDVKTVKGKLEADRVLVALQAAVVQEMQSKTETLEARIKTLETKVKRGGNALDREREAHGKTKRKIDALLKENMALRRELDACLREIRALETKLDRGL